MVSSENRQLSVLIAEDTASMAELLKALVAREGHRVAAVARTGVEAVALARATAPDLIVVDIEMPVMDGLAAARRILAERSVPVIVCTGRSDDHALEEAREMNIQAFLVKPFSREQLRSAMAIAMAQHAKHLAAIGEISALKARKPRRKIAELGLTERQTEVLWQLGGGQSNAQIAAALGLSARTVDKHVENLFAKLHVNTRTAAAMRALEFERP